MRNALYKLKMTSSSGLKKAFQKLPESPLTTFLILELSVRRNSTNFNFICANMNL